ncbi:hypothetical protein, partial [Streptomyces ipomoeae]|uniref:hypothetical protein n=1 Tax=Streptomyces ipomoeae TaxID=103232 RepID=UPI0029A89D17
MMHRVEAPGPVPRSGPALPAQRAPGRGTRPALAWSAAEREARPAQPGERLPAGQAVTLRHLPPRSGGVPLLRAQPAG